MMFDDSQAGLAIVQIDGQWHRLLPNNELDILSAIGGGPGTILVDEHGVAEPIINGHATLMPGKSYRSIDTRDPIGGAQSRRIREHAAQQNIHVELGIDKLEALMPHLHHDTKPQTGGQNELNTPKEVLEYLIKVGVMRATMPMHRQFYAAMMSGLFIALAGTLSLASSGGANGPWVKANFPSLPKLLTGVTFPVALILIVGYGGDLFTGNTMYGLVALLRGKIKLWQLCRCWTISFFGNLVGCLLSAYFLAYLTNLFTDEPYLTYVRGVGEKKVHLGFGASFLRGIGANACVCLSVFLCLVARDWLGRLVSIWWPMFIFCVIGYEHSIANMFFVPVSIWYGGALTVEEFITWCLIPSTLGNIVGGGMIIGASAYFLYPNPPRAPGAPLSTDMPTKATEGKAVTFSIPPTADKGGIKENRPPFMPQMSSNLLSSDRFSQDLQMASNVNVRRSADRMTKSGNGVYYNYNNNEFLSDVDGGLMVYFERFRTKAGTPLSVMIEGNIIVEDGRPSTMMSMVYPHATPTANPVNNNNNNNNNNKEKQIIVTNSPSVANQSINQDNDQHIVRVHSAAEDADEKVNNNHENEKQAEETSIEMGTINPNGITVERLSDIKHACEFRGMFFTRLSDDRIIRVDDNFCELVGYTRRELLHMSISQITYPEDIQIMRDQIQKRMNRFARRIPGFR